LPRYSTCDVIEGIANLDKGEIAIFFFHFTWFMLIMVFTFLFVTLETLSLSISLHAYFIAQRIASLLISPQGTSH
jgi:hypothetical protein